MIVYILAWLFIGAAALTVIDYDSQIYEWANNGPTGIEHLLCILFWPVVLGMYFYYKKQ